jgi:hypothetical protein
MPINNPFQNPAFGMASLTAAINLLPNRYGRLDELGLFSPKPVRMGYLPTLAGVGQSTRRIHRHQSLAHATALQSRARAYTPGWRGEGIAGLSLKPKDFCHRRPAVVRSQPRHLQM